MAVKLSVSVQDLLWVPFKRRADADKMRIILGGKPRPRLQMSAVTFTEDDGIVNQDFEISMYDEIPWLTGCEKKNSLFCWPCLLFEPSEIWNKTGVSDIVYLTEGAPEHEKSATHKDAEMKLQAFNKVGEKLMPPEKKDSEAGVIKSKPKCQQNMLYMEAQHPHTSSYRKESTSFSDEKSKVYHPTEVTQLLQPPGLHAYSTSQINNNDEKYKGIRKRLIDVCCLAFQLNHCSEYCDSNNLFEVEKYIKIMQMLKIYDCSGKHLSDDTINLMKNSPEVIDRVFDALVKVVKLAIGKEIQSSKYVSLILNQHSDQESKPKISSILRYMKNGKVFERFIGFSNKTNRHTADTLYKHIEAVLQEYGIENKICAVSLDGAVLCIDDLLTFLDKMKSCLPHCYFLPWHLHSVNYILQQSLSSLPTCGQFFKIIASIQDFFEENSDILMDFIHENHPTLAFIYSDSSLFLHCNNNRFASSQFLIAIKKFRQTFVNFFDSVIKIFHKVGADNVTKAFGFRKSLKQLQTVFLLEVFSRLFDMTASLNTALKEDKFEFDKDSTLCTLRTNIAEMHTTKFNEIWCCIEEEIAQESSQMDVYKKKKGRFISLFNAIVKLTVREIYCRYEPLVKLAFCNMFNFEINGGMEQFKLWTQSLKLTHRHFDESQIYNELVVLWSRDVFSKRSVTEFYEFLEESDLHYIFKALSNLSEFIITMPFEPAFLIGDVSKLKTIEKWSGNCKCASSGDVSILHIETDIFQIIKQSSSFHDEVLSVYTECYET